MPGLGRMVRNARINGLVNCFAALSVADPLDDGSGFVEANTIGSGGYSRQPITWDRTSPLPALGQPAMTFNSNALIWTSTAPWSAALTRPVAWIALYATSSGAVESDYIGWTALNPARLITGAGITINIPIGALKLTLGLQQY